MKSTLVILVLAGALCVAFAQRQAFQADITVRNDPNIQGTMRGIMDYDYAAKNQSIRWDLGPQEIITYNAKLRYLLCTGVCEAESWQEPMNIFFQQAGDAGTNPASIVVGGRTCTGYTKSSGNVIRVWADANGPCRADFSNGKQIEFANIRALESGRFIDWVGRGCPQQQCGKLIDLVLVFDESGSIDARSFTYMKTFAKDLANLYTFGPLGTAMGIVMFSSTARTVLNINPDKNSVVNAINSIQQQGGYTCLGCGIQTGYNNFVTYTRAGAQKVMIFMTDGQNNRQTSSFNTVLSTAKNYGIIIFAIGVGDADQSEMNRIGSSIPGVQTVFYSPTYAQLGDILNQLVIVTCVDIPGNPCGAGCKGYCSCGKTCICPSTCNDNDMCTVDSCNPNVNGAGCTYSATVCNSGNACKNNLCNPATGCYTTDVVCVNNDACKVVSCDPGVGCQTSPRNCDDSNPCTSDSCLSTGQSPGCKYAPVDCNKCQFPAPVVCTAGPCETQECSPATGLCVATPFNCDDGNICSDDSCNRATNLCEHKPVNCDDGNACTIDSCETVANATAGIVLGCNNIAINATLDCDDNNACTLDYCDPAKGCINEPIVCSDNLNCTVDTCNSILGCQFLARDCATDPSIKADGDCYVAACDEARGPRGLNPCFITTFPGRQIDECGKCDGDGSTCQGVDVKQAAGIAAGVLAAIIIGSIVVCAVLGAIGGKKGYDIYMRNKNNMTGANTNPLYHDNGLSGTNPMYTDEDSRL